MELNLEENVIQTEETTKKKTRHRKKQLYNSILTQMEFYFSDSNLAKDRFMSQLFNESPYIDLSTFLKFNKIRKLTTNLEDIKKAIKKSTLLELSEDDTKVMRKEPIKRKDNVDACTIYVERIKADATHDWLATIFSEFGKVVYVSIPKYKQNRANKGFAFIEYDDEKSAENALKFFETIGSKMAVAQVNPDELYSIATYNEENDIEKSAEKRKFDELGEIIDENKPKKIKTDEEISEAEENETKKKKKAKKEQKRKNHIKELGFQVLSKKEWKQVRNRYLDLKRKKMKEFKEHLRKAKHNTEKTKVNQATEEEPKKLAYTSGVIVKVTLKEPCEDSKKLKNDMKVNDPNIKYVDIPNPVGSSELFLRFNEPENAQNFIDKNSQWGKALLMTDDAEKCYWEKLENDRKTKFEKMAKKQRGTDKLLKKAAKEAGKHIRFDE